jgi:hypothetical protein
MTVQPQISSPSDYAPKQSNPVRLAGATIHAVDQIGLVASNEIEVTADEIVRGATEVADTLRILADAIREETKIASEQVAEFCNKATSLLEGLHDMRDRLLMNGHEPEADEAEDGILSVPVFMRKGPAEQVGGI